MGPEIRNLSSVTDVFTNVKAGEELKLTRDLATSPGLVLQVHASLATVEADVQRIRELERTELYKVSDPVACPPSPKFSRQVSPFVMSPSREKTLLDLFKSPTILMTLKTCETTFHVAEKSVTSTG